MKKLYLIGNGFDLAHGLKTKYSDFLLWYINKTVRSLNSSNSNIYGDDLFSIETRNKTRLIKEFDSLKSFWGEVQSSSSQIIVRSKNDFFEKILHQTIDIHWVDIEYEYYIELLKIFINYKHLNISKDIRAIRDISDLNSGFDLVKEKLIEYLQTINIENYNDTILARFKQELTKTKYSEVLFLVFNYTRTIDLYLKPLNISNYPVIYIHGKLGVTSNPIIFGYGDETDEYYSQLESLNINDFTRNMKSFWYLKTNNLRKLNQFINDPLFNVSIMGHSCGISDRVLLNSIFCHKHCGSIRIFYHQKSEGENDFFEKTQEISRHFPIDSKNKMRDLIVPFPDSVSLT
jgi:hypothetical protein